MVESRRRRRDARGDGPAQHEAGAIAGSTEAAAAPGTSGAADIPYVDITTGPVPGGNEASEHLRPRALTDILDRADKVFAAPATPAGGATAPAIVMDANSLPGACMGVTGLFSLALYKLRFRELETREAEALTNSLLRNLTAWDITIEDPRAAAAVDLVGCASGIVMIRVLERLRELEELRKRSPVQAATVARAEAPAPAGPQPAPAPKPTDNHAPEHDGAGIVAALTS